MPNHITESDLADLSEAELLELYANLQAELAALLPASTVRRDDASSQHRASSRATSVCSRS